MNPPVAEMPAGRLCSLAIAVLVGLAGCRSRSPAAGLEALHARAVRSMSAAGARVTGSPQRSSTDWSRDIRWNVEADKPWSSFLADLRRSTPALFDRCDFVERAVTCHRSLPGDRVQLEILLVSLGPPTRASVTLVGRAE